MKDNIENMLRQYREAKVNKMIKDQNKSIRILSGIQSKQEKKFRDRQQAKIIDKMQDPEMFEEKPGSLKTKLMNFQERRKKEFEEEYS